MGGDSGMAVVVVVRPYSLAVREQTLRKNGTTGDLFSAGCFVCRAKRKVNIRTKTKNDKESFENEICSDENLYLET